MTNKTTETRWGRSKRATSRWGIIGAVAAWLALAAGCSDDRPVKPQPVPYNIYATANKYFDGEKHSRIYIYDADSLTLLDSILLPNVGDKAQVSPDGRYLYIALERYLDPPYGYYIAKIDIATGEMEWTQEAKGVEEATPVSLLDNGQLILYGRHLLDAETGTLIRELDYFETNRWVLFDGPATGTEVVAVVVDSAMRTGTKVIAVDIETGKAHGLFEPRLGPNQPFIGLYQGRLHPDGRRVLIVGPRAHDVTDSWFLVGDLTTGELLLAARLSTPYGEIDISNDGTLAAVVDEADMGWGYGFPAVYVYDLVNYQLLKGFHHQELYYFVGQARFLPGDRRLAVFSSVTPIGSDWLQVFDLNTMTLEHVVDTPFYDVLGGGFAVGPRPSQ